MSHYGENEFEGVDLRSANSFAGVPDEFQRLWTPHRLAYIENGQQPPEASCPFCLAPEMSDEDSLIVHRGTHSIVIIQNLSHRAIVRMLCV